MLRFIPAIFCLITGSIFLAAPTAVQAQPGGEEMDPNTPEHLLDGTSFNYFYQNGSGLQIAFYDGMVRYEWIAGPRTGNRAADLSYDSRRMAEGLYLVSWHEISGRHHRACATHKVVELCVNFVHARFSRIAANAGATTFQFAILTYSKSPGWLSMP